MGDAAPDAERRQIVRALLDWLLAKHTNPARNEWASEAARSHRRVEPAPREPTLDDLLPLLGGGVALAGVAIVACAMIDAIAIGFYAYFIGEDPDSWPGSAVAAFGVFAVAVSLLMGWWLFRLRRWIATRGDTQNLEMIRAKRRSFTIGAMTLYVPLTPVVWVLIVSLAFSAN
ncbi:MAG: hypothetical protein JHC98_09275 [Thermoleophilaceae bacterium]|nr:hypothetical protein [Thermoleophilaceae bacterium]